MGEQSTRGGRKCQAATTCRGNQSKKPAEREGQEEEKDFQFLPKQWEEKGFKGKEEEEKGAKREAEGATAEGVEGDVWENGFGSRPRSEKGVDEKGQESDPEKEEPQLLSTELNLHFRRSLEWRGAVPGGDESEDSLGKNPRGAGGKCHQGDAGKVAFPHGPDLGARRLKATTSTYSPFPSTPSRENDSSNGKRSADPLLRMRFASAGTSCVSNGHPSAESKGFGTSGDGIALFNRSKVGIAPKRRRSPGRSLGSKGGRTRSSRGLQSESSNSANPFRPKRERRPQQGRKRKRQQGQRRRKGRQPSFEGERWQRRCEERKGELGEEGLPNREASEKEAEEMLEDSECLVRVVRSLKLKSGKAGPSQPSFTSWLSEPRTLGEMGVLLEDMMFNFLECHPTLRSRSTFSGVRGRTFPLIPDHILHGLPSSGSDHWLSCVCMSLNSYYGVEVLPSSAMLPRSKLAAHALQQTRECIDDLSKWSEKSEVFSWEELWRVKTVDYSGEEVHTAQSFRWANIEPTIPREVGMVPLESMCRHGTLAYVNDFESFLKPEEEMVLRKPPRVQVAEEDWHEVCQGLLDRKLCKVLPKHQLYHVGGRPVLSGLFGVSKNEFTAEGVEHLRLIMNLTPLNELCRPLASDIGTLPSWACMSPLFLGDNEELVVSSEDIRCFFYIFRVPTSWHQFLGFNREVPVDLLPQDMQGESCVLVSNVLPTGFLNSVGIAQHVHRNVISSAWKIGRGLPGGEAEIRKDRPYSVSPHLWRVYLDNYDELQKVDKSMAALIAGTPSDATEMVREQYDLLGLPRHPKKSVQQAHIAEVQGAIVDGQAGIIYPKPSKMLKYLQAVVKLLEDGWANKRQLQVAAGGLVYVSMFRRPLLGSLNAIWKWIESFAGEPPVVRKPIPVMVQWELLRFLGLLPLARLDLRSELDPVITASDASLGGGGFCATTGLTPYGCAASNLLVRGEVPEWLRGAHVWTHQC